MKEKRVLTIFSSLATLTSLIQASNVIRNIELEEGEIYHFSFDSLLFGNSDGLPFTIESSNDDLIEQKSYNIIEVNSALEIPLKSDANDTFRDVRCSLDNTGNKNQISLIYKRSNPNAGSKFYIEVKEVTYLQVQNKSASQISVIDTLKLNLTQKSLASTTCSDTVLVNEFNRVLLVCSSSQNNQFYIIMLCSDNSCSEVSENLKIAEFQRHQRIENIKMKRMPGISPTTFSFLVYFENTANIEYIVFDNNGKINSVVYTLMFNLKAIRYFSGQVLVIEGNDKENQSLIVYSFFDFGIHRLNFETLSLRRMSHFGVFANSYVNPFSGEIVVELMDKLTLADLSLDRQTYEFAVEFSKSLPEIDNRKIIIFEIGGKYQLVGIGSSTDRMNISDFLVLKNQDKFFVSGQSVTNNRTTNSQTWVKVQGFDQLSGCRVDKSNKDDWKLELFDVNFKIPSIKINATSKLIPPNSNKQVDLWFKLNNTAKQTIGTIKVRVWPKSANRMDVIELFLPYVYMTRDEISTDDEVLISDVIEGNYIAINSMGLSNGDTISYKNKINPLLYFTTLEITNSTIRPEYSDSTSLVSVSILYNVSYSCQVLFYSQPNHTVSVYLSKEKSLQKHHHENLNIGFMFFEPFNETMFIAHSYKGLFLYDAQNKRPQELIFDSGACTSILLLRHSSLDLTIWCISKSSIFVYYARDLIEGRTGIRKLPLTLEAKLGGMLLATSEYYPDYIFALDDKGKLATIKVEAKSNLLVKEIGSTQIAPPTSDYKSISMKFQAQYLFLFQTRRIGYGEQLVFQFYFLKNPLNIVKTKTIEANFIFSPDPANMRVYHMKHNMKYSVNHRDPRLKEGFAVPVLVNGKYKNILFIDPKAPKMRTIPCMLFNKNSEITYLKVGSSVETTSYSYFFGIIVHYAYEENGVTQRIIAKVSQISTFLRLTPNTEGNMFYSRQVIGKSANYFPTNITFDKDIHVHNNEQLVLEVKGKKTDFSLTNREKVIFTAPGEMIFDMDAINSNGLVNYLDRPSAYIYQLIDVVNLTTGNVFRWSLEVESYLEKISQTIDLKPLVRERKVVHNNQISLGTKFAKAEPNCTVPSREKVTVAIFANSSSREKTNKTIYTDITFCMDRNGVVVYSKIHDHLISLPLVFIMNNRLTNTNVQYLRVENKGYFLEVVSLRRPLGKEVFADFYFIEYNLTIDIPTMKLTYMGRRFFSEKTSEYAIISETTGFQTSFDLYEWIITKKNQSAYNCEVYYERWRFNPAKQPTPMEIEASSHLKAEIDASSLPGNTKMDIFDDLSAVMLQTKDKTSISLLLEHSTLDSYILKFSKADLASQSTSLKPAVWRVDNPLYGFTDNADDIKSIKNHWLMVTLRLIGDVSYLIIYIVPDSSFDYQPTRANNSIYTKEVLTLEEVTDIAIEPFTNPGSKSDLSRHYFGQCD